ncbi:hypothetical protein CH063_09118 [Colletotrichum higginsianum]|uniref:Uncharacterized protein n=1 Tax=Colletotrichum higginsianum (strain IMI 349063) TaxID=759273 RepID=H1VCD5_COLHI|nr:hypothetical protein CH063_09118 [Colletotrichum higginsianum]
MIILRRGRRHDDIPSGRRRWCSSPPPRSYPCSDGPDAVVLELRPCLSSRRKPPLVGLPRLNLRASSNDATNAISTGPCFPINATSFRERIPKCLHRLNELDHTPTGGGIWVEVVQPKGIRTL